MSFRSQRIGEEIRKVLSKRLIKGLTIPLQGFVTISHVDLSKDLSHANVYYSVYGKKEECEATKEALIKQTKELRKEIGTKLRLRYVPNVKFVLDGTPENAEKINKLLTKNLK
ncbi:30S ribosome-binding factor RbfA [Sulfobacillus acidophilus]|uniref:Ribosome-binding factor A n=1 Tax=Sulfobacillus acidophilus TaxID=53633 RepID=A0ABS3AWS4_9FIRM|nr:30S ribosome-binding factor RbfA [Sulfobacillus acidophilus]